MHKKLLTLASATLLSACSNEHIDTVKNMEFELDPTYTYEQAFSNRPVCDSSGWDSFEDNKGRLFVEYTCELNEAEEFYEEVLTHKTKTIEDEYNIEIEKFDAERQVMATEIKSSKAKLKEAEAQLQPVQNRYNNEGIPMDELWEFQDLQSKVDHLDHNVSVLSARLEENYGNDSRQALLRALSLKKISANDDLEEFKVKAVVEKYQCVITNSGVTFATAGRSYQYKKSPDKFFPFNNMRWAMTISQKEEIKDYPAYREILFRL